MSTRRTFDPDDDAPVMPPHGQMVPELRLPCRWCGSQTLRTMLAQYGARCLPCFDAYVAEPQPVPAVMGDKRRNGPKAWAYALRERQARGERLTEAQEAMWRTALQVELTREQLAADEAEEVTP